MFSNYRYLQCSSPSRGTVAGSRDVVASATILALAALFAVLAVGPVGTLDVALLACKEKLC